jgi:pimeloyl-ACP methyl ester carboxylesterase
VVPSGTIKFFSITNQAHFMATYVLVHGGGHGGWCYQSVARILRAHGHEVYAPTLTGLADREHLLSAEVNLDTHITDIVKLLHYENLRDVILVGHSYGGMVITGVADRATDRIANLAYLDAAFPDNGQSLVDHAGDVILAAREKMRVVNGIELVLYPGEDPMGFYGVTDPGQIAWMKPRLTPHPWACFAQKLVLTNEAAMRRLPISFIFSAVQIDNLTDEIRGQIRAFTQGRFWEIDTGHDLMISEPQKTAEALLGIASA